MGVRASRRFEAIGIGELADYALVQGLVGISHLTSVEARSQLFADAFFMKLDFLDFSEYFIEVFEENIGLLTIQNMMVADYGARLHAKLRFRQD